MRKQKWITLALCGGLGAAAFTLERDAMKFDRIEASPAVRQRLAKAKHLGEIPPELSKKGERNLATLEYDFEVPADNWYRIEIPGNHGAEFEIDRNCYGITGRTPGAFPLRKGKHTLMLRKRNWFHPWGKVDKIIFTDAGPSAAERLRLTGVRFVHEAIVGVGQPYRLRVASGLPGTLEARLVDRATRRDAGAPVQIKLPDNPFGETEIAVSAAQPGWYDLRFRLNGKDLDPQTLPPFSLLAMDNRPVRAEWGKTLQKKLIQVIDCAAQPPEYSGGGETRVVKRSFGSYRESGNVSWITHMNANEPSWFAYKIQTPRTDRQYLVEVEYPDDAERTFAISIRNAGNTAYPLAAGAETGGDYPLSNTLKTCSVLGWGRSADSRLVIANAADGNRGAAAKIRVYEVESPRLAPLTDPRVKGRDFNLWNEEGTAFVGLFAGNTQQKNAGEFAKTADRWAETMSYMGANVLYPTLMVYQFGLNPGDYNPFATRATTDLAEIVLLAAEKYGSRVLFDFHPEARNLSWLSETRENALRTRSGQVSTFAPLYGPLHPLNRQYLLGMVSEFVNRYKHSPAFKGISVRHMTWYNHALNNFNDLEWGYDDYTVGRFEQETKIKIPGISGANDPARFEKRYQFLTSGAMKEKWIRWRCEKIAELYRELSKIVRTARADLELHSLVFTREGGVDPAMLKNIPNLVLSDSAAYGRRGRGENNRIKFLRQMLSPLPEIDRFSSGAAYFEATGSVIPPEQLGFPPNTRRVWMSAVVNPGGRLMLERFALALARVDSLALQDGGNAYCVGQMELRDFLRDYRMIPARRLQLVDNAADPVTVRAGQDTCYAVNMMPYPVNCKIIFPPGTEVRRAYSQLPLKLKGDALELRLDAYELQTFRSSAAPLKVASTIPATELNRMKEQLEVLERAAAALPKTRSAKALKLASELKTQLSKNAFWRFDATLRTSEAILRETGIELPNFLQYGFPVTPPDARSARDLAKCAAPGAELRDSPTIHPDWSGETVLVGAPGAPLKLKLPVPVTGDFKLRCGTAAGGNFSGFAIRVNGKPAEKISAPSASAVQPRVATTATPIRLRDGMAEFEFIPEPGKRAAISHLELTPVYTVIPPYRWRASRNFDRVKNFTAPLEPETARDFAKWTRLTGDGPFVSLRLGTPVKDGTVRYAVTFLHSPDARKIRLGFGVDYRALIWLNAQPVKPSPERKHKSGAPNRCEETLDVSLRPGWNELLIKVGSGSGNNGFWMEVSNSDDLKFADLPVESQPGTVEIPDGGKAIHQFDFERKTQHVLSFDNSGRDSHTGKGASRMGNYFAGTKVESGKRYTLQVYAKGVRDNQGARVQINWNNAKGKLIKYDLICPRLTTEYQRIRLERTAPPGATGAFLIVGTDKGGEWVDDLWFGEVPEKTGNNEKK